MFETTKLFRIPENTPVPPPEDDATTQKTGPDAVADSDDISTDIACSDSDYEQGDSDLEFAAEYCV